MARYLIILQKLFYTCWVLNNGGGVQPIASLIFLFAEHGPMTEGLAGVWIAMVVCNL